MKLAYVIGPYRDASEYNVRLNIRSAESAALDLWHEGFAVICPHKNTAGFNGARGLPDYTWLKGDIEMLKRCDFAYVVGDYRTSQGSLAEIRFCEENNIPVYYSMDDLLGFEGG